MILEVTCAAVIVGIYAICALLLMIFYEILEIRGLIRQISIGEPDDGEKRRGFPKKGARIG